MKIALSISENRIAPLFDVADSFVELDFTNGKITDSTRLELPSLLGPARIFDLAERGVEFLICGAISRQFSLLAESSGITVYGFISGPADVIIKEFCKSGNLRSYRMPGCRRSGQGCQGRQRRRRKHRSR
ncbi:MAG: NifB/NifX family molybdenum-iron cluster-binding protein [Candidatus Rifleibacteriota bacterium]